MIPTFKWNVERDLDIQIEFRVIETQFGDGYVQTAADGINTKNEQYSMRVNAYEAQAKQIMNFFNELEGYRSFFWTPPLGEIGLYRCKDPKPTPQGGGLYTITGTFIKSFSSPA